MPIAVVIIAGIVALWWKKQNNKGQILEGATKALDPETSKTGDIAVGFWVKRFEELEKRLNAIHTQLTEIQATLNVMNKE